MPALVSVSETAAAAAIKQLEEADFAKNFGNLELDTQGIQSYVKSLGDDFKAAYTEVDGFKTALDNAVTSYQTASTTFSATLFQDMLTNTKLTEAEKQQFTDLLTRAANNSFNSWVSTCTPPYRRPLPTARRPV